jgi:hypothetical protein
MQESNISQILTAIETESFLHPTFIASGHETVADILSGTQEVQTLLDSKNVSLPLMRTRYREQDAGMADGARLVYFVLFGLAQDRQMIGEIIPYLKRSRDLSTARLWWPWHPFLHGVRALELITDRDVQAPRSSAPAKQFDEFLTQVENWAKTHADPPKP